MISTELKYYIEDTKRTGIDLVKSVDDIAKQKAEEVADNKAELEKMRISGIYTKEYLDNLKQEDKKPFGEMLRRSHGLRKQHIERNLEQIRASIEEYINGELNPDLSNKITTCKQMGIKLTDREMQTLEKTAVSYMDKKIFGQYAKETGYKSATVPNYDLIYNSLNDYVNSALRLFEYGGKDAELIEYIERYNKDEYGNNRKVTGVDLATCSSADAFIKNNATELFIKFLEDTGIDLNVKPLTDEELEMIEELIQKEKYPYSVETNVKQYKNNLFIRDLLLRHNEYRKYLL